MAPNIDFSKYLSGTSLSKDQLMNKGLNTLGTLAGNNSNDSKIQAAADFTISFLLALGCGENQNAQNEVGNNDDAANNIENAVQTASENTNQQVEELVSKMMDKIEEIEKYIEQIEEKGEEKEEYEQKIQELKTTIEQNKAIVNDPSSSHDEKMAAINNIKAASGEIDQLITTVQSVLDAIAVSKDGVDNAQSESSDNADQVNNVIDEGTQALQEAASDAAAQQTINAGTAAKGVVNETTGTAAETAAATLEVSSNAFEFIPFVGSILGATGNATATKLFQTASDQFGASATRIGGSANTIKTVMGTVSLITSNLGEFGNYANYAIGLMDNALNLSDNFYSVCKPIGEWYEAAAEVSGEGEAINEAADEALAILDNETPEETDSEGEENNNQISNNEGNAIFNYDLDNLELNA